MKTMAQLPTVTRAQLPNHDYHQNREYLSNSACSMFLASPALFGTWLRGEYTRSVTKALRIGSALDGILTSTFDEGCVLRPPMDRRTKVGKAMYEDFLANIGDRMEIPDEEYKVAEAMAESVMKHPIASDLLADVVDNQSSLWWTEGNSNWKVRFDGEMTGNRILELKTHAPFKREADNQREWQTSVWDYGYHRQAALYRHALALEKRIEDQDVSHTTVAVGSSFPYDVHVFQYTEELLQVGMEELRAISHEIHLRKSMDMWELDPETRIVGVPGWVAKQRDRKLIQEQREAAARQH